MPGFSYSVESFGAFTRQAEHSRQSAIDAARVIAASTALPATVYIDPRHTRYAVVQPGGAVLIV